MTETPELKQRMLTIGDVIFLVAICLVMTLGFLAIPQDGGGNAKANSAQHSATPASIRQ